MTTEPTPTPSAGIASEMSNEELAAALAANDFERLAFRRSFYLNEAARRLRLTPDRPKGGGEDLAARTWEAAFQAFCDGDTAEGTSHQRAIKVIFEALSAPPAPPDAAAQRNESGATGQEPTGETFEQVANDILTNRSLYYSRKGLGLSQAESARRLANLLRITFAAPAIPAGQRADVEALAGDILRELSSYTDGGSYNERSGYSIKLEILTHHLTAQPNRGDGDMEWKHHYETLKEAVCRYSALAKTADEDGLKQGAANPHFALGLITGEIARLKYELSKTVQPPLPPLSDVRLLAAHEHARAVMSNVDAEHGSKSVEKFDELLRASDVRAATDGERLGELYKKLEAHLLIKPHCSVDYVPASYWGPHWRVQWGPKSTANRFPTMAAAIESLSDAAMAARGRNGEGA